MHRPSTLASFLALTLFAPAAFAAEEAVDWAAVGRIRDEGFRRSQVMETAAQLTDVQGPRLTGSPQYKKAADWTREQLEKWGLANARLESWPFGRGWSFERVSAHVVAPQSFPLWAIPKAWTDGTNGQVRGKVLRVKVETEADVEKLKGQIAGKVLWVGEARELKAPEQGVFKRYTDEQLDDLEKYQIPGPRMGRGPRQPFDREAFLRRRRVQRALEKLYETERPLAVVEPSDRDADVIRLGSGGSRKAGDPKAVTQLVVSATQWNRVARLLDRKIEVELELDVKATFHETDTNAYNVLAELPGTRQGEGRAGDARRPPRLLAPRHRGHGQRGRLRGDDGGDADPQGDRREAEAHGARRAVGRRGAGAARLARLRLAAPRLASRAEGAGAGRDAVLHAQRAAAADDAEARARQALGLLQPRQRHRPPARHLPAGERGHEADLRGLDGGGEGPRLRPHHDAQHERHRPPVVRLRSASPASSSSRTRSSTWTAASSAPTTPRWTPTTACSART